jgi:23S rRNA (guanosine2251-2'-O)-methyltransferase
MAKAEHHYGLHAIEALLSRQPEQVLNLFVLQGREDERLSHVLKLAKTHGVSVQKASRETLNKLADSPQHQGVVAAVRPLPVFDETDLERLLEQHTQPLLLILDQITDPHNVGACLRTAAAMGVTAVIAPRDRAAGLTPTARKVAAGGAEVVPFIQVTNLARSMQWLKDQGVFMVGTLLDDTAKPLEQCALTGAIGIVMGAEDTGMRRLTRDSCDQLAYIPMSGRLQSLNVSVACGMALYEVCRQRGAAS